MSLLQAGGAIQGVTDAEGLGTVTIDRAMPGEHWVVAALPGHRSVGTELLGDLPSPIPLELAAVQTDNPAWEYGDPGVGGGETSLECSHCHQRLVEQFGGSAHRRAAKNPWVRDVYTAERVAEQPGHGGCADCHAPGIPGPAGGGHDLLSAEGLAYDEGVHCDFCHKVADVDLDRPPGVGGRMVLGRPLEEPGLMGFEPVMYGPYPDVLNPFMGGSWAPVFSESRYCAGCHEYTQQGPSGPFPVHTTFSEWKASTYAAATPCQSCHMPPIEAANAADMDLMGLEPSRAAGFARPPGAVRSHRFDGPHTARGGPTLLESAASVGLERVESSEGRLSVRLTVKNVGAGHSLPTGEPLRAVLAVVEATCAGDPLTLLDGPTLPATAGGEAGPARRLPGDGELLRPLAGAPGLAFERVLVGNDGQEHVHHGAAVGVARDTRLKAGEERTATLMFAVPEGCAQPSAEARLVYRPVPLALAQARGWDARDWLMAGATLVD